MECILPFLAVGIIVIGTLGLFHFLDALYDAVHGKSGGCPSCGKESYLEILCGDCYYNKGVRYDN